MPKPILSALSEHFHVVVDAREVVLSDRQIVMFSMVILAIAAMVAVVLVLLLRRKRGG